MIDKKERGLGWWVGIESKVEMRRVLDRNI
jgi:hypothetical protein